MTGQCEVTPRYSAGWNAPGCLPEVPPEYFETFAGAVSYLLATVRRFQDEEPDVPSGQRWQPVIDALLTVARDAVNLDNGTLTFGVGAEDRSLTFWVTPMEDWGAVCYSDHNEDIRTKGSCDLCGGTEVQS